VTSSEQHTRRIARNTLLLYARMAAMMVVSLWASREVLSVLGASDNNIYAVVGSFVALFWFLNTAMSSATQRFLNVEVEKGGESVGRVFSTSINIHAAIALVVLVLGETVGLWFVETQLVIPAERMQAARWVYQFALLTSCFNIVRVPYNAMIVAAERMSMYALLTVVEAVLRLGAVLVLVLLPGDKLVLYGVLICGVVLGMTLIFRWYCRRKFAECRYRRPRDGALALRMMKFSGWSLLGSGANAASLHGVNLLFNIMAHASPLNVAMEKASGISNAAYAFVLNFQTAFTPRMMKSYAAGDENYFRYLIFRASKYSYFLLLVIALPFVVCAGPLIEWWLAPNPVPAHTANFARLLMCFLLIDAISGPLWSAVQATGRIRNYQITMSAVILLSLPLAWLLLRLGYPPEAALGARVAVNVACLAVRVGYLGRRMAFPVGRYLRDVVAVAAAVTVLAAPVPWVVFRATEGVGGVLAAAAASCVWTAVVIFAVGMGRKERGFVMEKLGKIWATRRK
jgi:O-antigen/teichoic acid export membrane protein